MYCDSSAVTVYNLKWQKLMYINLSVKRKFNSFVNFTELQVFNFKLSKELDHLLIYLKKIYHTLYIITLFLIFHLL